MKLQSCTPLFEDYMEKWQGKFKYSKVCLLAFLSALFWFSLLYFRFSIHGGSIDVAQLNSVSSSSDSISNPPQSTPISYPHPKVNVSHESMNNTIENGTVSNSNPNVKVSHESVINNSTIDAQKSSVSPFEIGTGASSPPKVDVHNDAVINSSNTSVPHQQSLSPFENGNSSSKVENYPFMKALQTAENKSDPCGGRYIFVHDLPPMFNDHMLKECKSLSLWTNMCKFISNNGLGPPLENAGGVFSDSGWYATNQFAVDVIFNNRMKQYECLTRDSSIAAAIFVPFYAGFDIARYLWGNNISVRDGASLALVDWLTKRPEWGIMGGKDHFLVAGRITWDFRRQTDQESDWGNKLLLLPEARNMSTLVVESSPWNANDFGIPYPTYFHPAKDADVFVWQDRMRKLERPWLYCFAGAPRPGDPTSIRGQIIDDCKNTKVCKLLECDFGESKCHSPSSIMQMFQNSVFCLQPAGDSYTRRSTFDSILAGCIPVFFHPGSAYTQYTWHLPRNYSKYSVFISENDIRARNVSIEEKLASISPEQVKEMREEVINLIPRITYADPRSKLETIEDAFDVAVDAVIRKVTRLRKDIIEGRKDDNFMEELSWKYSLFDEGDHQYRPHEWDKYFELKNKTAHSSRSSTKAAKNQSKY